MFAGLAAFRSPVAVAEQQPHARAVAKQQPPDAAAALVVSSPPARAS